MAMTDKERAVIFARTLRCNCDLDNYVPEPSTGHSFVCRIHKYAIAERYDMPDPVENAIDDVASGRKPNK